MLELSLYQGLQENQNYLRCYSEDFKYRNNKVLFHLIVRFFRIGNTFCASEYFCRSFSGNSSEKKKPGEANRRPQKGKTFETIF